MKLTELMIVLVLLGLFASGLWWANEDPAVDPTEMMEHKAGVIEIIGASGQRYWLWVDFEGKLRIGDKHGFEALTGGMKVGVQ